MDWAAGLLGGVMGAGSAINQLSEERRKELAENLRRQALEDMQGRLDLKKHGYEKEIHATDTASREKIASEGLTSQEKIASEHRTSAEKIASEGLTSQEKIASEHRTSAEKIASDRNTLEKWIHEQENNLKAKINTENISTRKAAEMKAKIAAYTEARHVLENNGSTEEANAVLEAADLPTYEDYVKEPGSEGGLFGWGKKEPIIGRRLNKQEANKPTVDDLVKEGQKAIPPGVGIQSTPGSQLARLVNLHKTAYERGKDPMTNPDIAAATKAYLGQNPEAEKNFVSALNSAKITERPNAKTNAVKSEVEKISKGLIEQQYQEPAGSELSQGEEVSFNPGESRTPTAPKRSLTQNSLIWEKLTDKQKQFANDAITKGYSLIEQNGIIYASIQGKLIPIGP
jgi:hypothetical protein